MSQEVVLWTVVQVTAGLSPLHNAVSNPSISGQSMSSLMHMTLERIFVSDLKRQRLRARLQSGFVFGHTSGGFLNALFALHHHAALRIYVEK